MSGAKTVMLELNYIIKNTFWRQTSYRSIKVTFYCPICIFIYIFLKPENSIYLVECKHSKIHLEKGKLGSPFDIPI